MTEKVSVNPRFQIAVTVCLYLPFLIPKISLGRGKGVRRPFGALAPWPPLATPLVVTGGFFDFCVVPPLPIPTKTSVKVNLKDGLAATLITELLLR